MGALGSERGLRRLTLPQATPEGAMQGLGEEAGAAEDAPQSFEGLHRQLEAYLGGRLTRFDLTLDMEGYSPFFGSAWRACASIPAGETRTYRWLATQAGNAAAVRAAGQAMARNPLPIIIPCHRVVGSDGGLHGYGGGLEMKQQLLELERRAVTGERTP
ncbi:MAG: methylated-DNA--[protein]-cysteine S-methyltransferase [Chloroflexi bacterium]|nr:methylated-DNA--[protein]-cysteine S-methyltransferase [Chloroflexota bacterium]